MKVCVITGNDVFYIHRFFSTFIPLAKSSDKIEIAAMTLLPTFKKQSRLKTFKELIDFYGPWHFFTFGLKYAWRRASNQTLLNLVKQNNIPIWDTTSVNSEEFITKIREEGIDCILSISASQIFKKNLIQSVPKGCINSHSSILPDNRGLMPVFWSMFREESEIGVTVHFINEKIDKGNIIRQERIPYNGESLHDLILKTKELSAHLVLKTLEQLSQQDLQGFEMAPGGRYNRFPTAQEVREFKKSGKRIF